jgi:actinorhodin biosynthesis protein ActVIA
VVGRQALIAAINATIPLSYGKRIFRHWFDMIRITPVDSDTIQVSLRALVSVTAEDGTVTFEPSSTVCDVLIRQGGTLYTESRAVDHDLADPAAYWARRSAST